MPYRERLRTALTHRPTAMMQAGKGDALLVALIFVVGAIVAWILIHYGIPKLDLSWPGRFI